MSIVGVMGGEEIMGWRKGPRTADEDRLLIEYVKLNGEGRWNSVATLQGLKRNGKSCRLRWVNYLRPDLKTGQITSHEEKIIVELHTRWGNRWSTIARSLAGRTDNEINNYWRTHFKNKAISNTSISAHNNNNNIEKTRTRLLKKHQFILQQQQQTFNNIQLNNKKTMRLLFNDDNNETNRMAAVTRPKGGVFYPNVATSNQEQHRLCFSMINSNNNDIYTPSSVPEALSSNDFQDIIMWDNGLWNLDDFQGNFCANKICSLQQPITTPFY